MVPLLKKKTGPLPSTNNCMLTRHGWLDSSCQADPFESVVKYLVIMDLAPAPIRHFNSGGMATKHSVPPHDWLTA